jgi:hypothetical protein
LKTGRAARGLDASPEGRRLAPNLESGTLLLSWPLSGTLTVAILAFTVAAISVAWHIGNTIAERRSRRPSVVATITGMSGEPALVTFTNVSPSHARVVTYLAVEGGNRYEGGVPPHAHLAPNETQTMKARFRFRAGRTVMIWAWLDEHGNVYARNNDGHRIRYDTKRAKSERVTLDSLFDQLYPREPLPGGQGTPIRMWE